MKLIALITVTLMLAGCAAIQQRIILEKCLKKCNDNDVACINACGNLLRSECR